MKPLPQEVLTRAIENGRNEARSVVASRDQILAARAQAFGLAATTAAAPARGILVAEGDSWFDYPFHDILKVLEDDYGYSVESVAHKGDRVEEMAYAGGQLEGLSRLLEKLIARGTPPKALLLSGGGNDVAGKEFGMLLNHSRSTIAGLNESVMQGVIDERVRVAYVTILGAVTEICRQRLGNPLPILVHGYDHPVPDGRGFLGGWSALPGPWLEPGFREKGFGGDSESLRRTALAEDLIDRFNDMLQSLVVLPAFAHVRYVDLRNTLSTAENDYTDWWANELHPTKRGFKAVTEKVAGVLATLP